ncbi:Serine/threonine-protein kinase RUNKEL [Arachis hypogaea]|nr:Serine/threonine-protein kinase RUNKEL [Arachis hypogaea]
MCATDKSVLGLSSNVLSSYYYYDLVPLPGSNNESWCQGLDGLASRSAEYYKQGARFAKWQTVVSIPCGPSALAVKEAAWGLARYAAISQDNGLVPIVEPKILLDGDHPIERTLYINVISNLCYIYRAARKQESMRLTAGSCLVRLVRFNHPSIQLVAEKLSFKDLASSLVKGSPREQQVSLNLLNMAMLGSHMLTNIGRYLIPLAEDKNLIPSLLSLVEQGSEILKGKALFFVALLCKHGRRWLPHFLAVHCLNTKCGTKQAAHRLKIIFGLAGLKAAELHGNLTQAQFLEAENMITHKEEIFSRSKRTWFVTETEKKVAAKAPKKNLPRKRRKLEAAREMLEDEGDDDKPDC